MDRTEFKAIFTQCVTPVARKICEAHNQRHSAKEETYRLFFNENEELIEGLYEDYISKNMIDNEKDEEKKQHLIRLLEEGFSYPPPILSQGYFDSTVRGLFYSNVTYGINPILLANVFYLLESYFYAAKRHEPSNLQDVHSEHSP
jgi:hypothetical protein